MNAFTEFDMLTEDPLYPVLDAGIYVEPKDHDATKEDPRQIAFCNAMKRDHPHILVHANKNGGRQSDWEKVQGKKMGVYAGYPDLSLDWSRGSAEIEWKDGNGSPERHQIECLNRLHRMGKKVAICRTKDGAFAWLRSIGAPI